MAARLLDRRPARTLRGCAGVFALAFAASSFAAAEPLSPSRPIRLFNGRNLIGWYTWLREHKYEDPKHVFSVRQGAIRISGEEWGGIATRQSYRDYHLVVEWKWGGATWGDRKQKARDSGILIHSVGEDGAAGGNWLESIESQIIEGGTGDIILVAGKNRPSLTVQVREGERGELYWTKDGESRTRDRGRFNWFGRDPAWKDVIGFRGAHDVEKSMGEWNRQEIIADDDTLTYILNGVVVNHGTRSSHFEGKIQLQSEGAEILFRRIELLPLSRKASRR
ncbi:MAG TPA: DUF1080 domain-containing protein [Bryobacteraceae bacterium]|nr:DUF1080 domain-containing protein [Bryobacteraceae bacterium]